MVDADALWPMEGLRLHHTGMVVGDVEAAIGAFAALGFTAALRAAEPSDQYSRIVGVADLTSDLVQLAHPSHETRLEFIQVTGDVSHAAPGLPVRPGVAHVAFVADDFSGTVGRLSARGFRPLGAVVDYEEGPAVYMWSPAGTVVEIEGRWTS